MYNLDDSSKIFFYVRSNGHKTDFPANTDDFTINVAYISVAVNLKPLQ